MKIVVYQESPRHKKLVEAEERREKQAQHGPSALYQKFKDAFWPLCKTDRGSKSRRLKAWKLCDTNSNGEISMKELDIWVKRHLSSQAMYGKDGGEVVWKHFRSSYIAHPIDVHLATFRVFLVYLVLYAEMYDAFAQVEAIGIGIDDVTQDVAIENRIVTLDKILQGKNKLKGFTFKTFHNLDFLRAQVIFKEMDINANGVVTLMEWCKYLEDKELAMGTERSKLLDIGDDDDHDRPEELEDLGGLTLESDAKVRDDDSYTDDEYDGYLDENHENHSENYAANHDAANNAALQGWKEQADPDTGDPCYYNDKTGV